MSDPILDAAADRILELEAELGPLLALARRVHAECGPEQWSFENWTCQYCAAKAHKNTQILHAPDCLWFAAEACLREAGEL